FATGLPARENWGRRRSWRLRCFWPAHMASVALLSVCGPAAEAQTYDQFRKWCFGESSTDDETIRGCDAVLKLRREAPANLVSAMQYRGLAYFNKGQIDKAHDDFDQAVKVGPWIASNFELRGNAHLARGQYTQAIEDYDRALTLKPDYASALDNRGSAY